MKLFSYLIQLMLWRFVTDWTQLPVIWKSGEFSNLRSQGFFPRGTQYLQIAPSHELIYSGVPWLMVICPSSGKKGFIRTWWGMPLGLSCCLDQQSNKVIARLLKLKILFCWQQKVNWLLREDLEEWPLCIRQNSHPSQCSKDKIQALITNIWLLVILINEILKISE